MVNEEYEVFYLTTERQGLYIGNKLIKTVEEVQGKVKQFELFEEDEGIEYEEGIEE